LPTVTAGGRIICNGSSTTITASGANTYSWSNGLGTGVSKTVNPTLTTIYSVTGTDANNCTNTSSATVTVNSLPTVTAGGGIICNGSSTTITASGANTYSWSNGLGTGASKTVNPTETTIYSVTGTDVNNCTNTATSTVTVNSIPTITASSGTICSGSNSNLFAGDGMYFKWSTNESTQQIIVSPVETTTYSVTITGTDGCTASDFVVIDVVGNKAGFSFQINKITNIVTFTDTSKGNISIWYWDFNDNNYSNIQNPKNQYSKAGIYNACLTVFDQVSLCQSTSCEDITIENPPCHASFVYSLDTSTNTFTFTDQSIGSSLIHYWEFGDGNNSNAINPQHQFIDQGYYTIKLTINDTANQCMDEYSTVVLAGKTGVGCKTDYSFNIDLSTNTAYFMDKSVGFISPTYHWDFGDNNSSFNLPMPNHIFKGGFYDVCLTMQDNISGCQNFICKNIKVDTLKTSCLANFIFSINSSNNEASFTDKSIGNIDSWIWDFGDNTNSAIQNPMHSYTSGYFKVHLRVKSSTTGCQSDEINLIGIGNATHHLKDIFSYFMDNTSKKKGVFPVDFKGATYGDASQVNWDFGDGTSDSSTLSPTHNYALDSIYQVCLTVSNSNTNQTDEYCDSIAILVAGVNELIKNITTLGVYPNPIISYTTINYQLQKYDRVEIKVIDLVGHEITTILDKKQDAGVYNLKWDTSDLNAGIYFLQLDISNKTILRKIVKLK